jgi:hypothetical protein
MKLITEELRKQLPPLYSQENELDPMVICKFFTPDSSFTWFIIEFDGDDLLFCKVYSHLCPDGELGYSSLSEIESVRGALGLGIERDLYFKPKRLSECKG